METTAYDKPVPQPSYESQPYWDGLREHKLMLQQCAECGQIRHYPRAVCPKCYSMDIKWARASGRGTVHSWTISHHAFQFGFKKELPLILVIVDLEEGVRMNSQLKGASADDLRIGLAVEVIFEDATRELSLPYFRIAR